MILRIVIINIFHHIAVKLLFGTDERLDSSFKGKGKIRILHCHIFVELTDFLGLRCQEVIML